MNLTPQDKIYLRQQPHSTTLFLSVYQPKTVYQTQIASGVVQFGETQVDFTDSITGSYLNTYPNMTALIGTQPGQDDVGRIRLRYASGTYAKFAENNVIWEQNQYVTFIDYINIEAIFPRIIKDPDNDENVIFYKDDDIPYSNQNSIYGSFPCAGSHRAAIMTSGSVDLFWSATGTHNVKEDSLTYAWHFEGGTPTGSSSHTPGYISYDTPGHYKTKLVVTSSSGADDTTYRYVSIYNPIETGANIPIQKWRLNDFTGSRPEGGYTVSVRVWESLSQIEPNALVVIFADDHYGDTKVSLGGNGENNEQTVFVGYILKDSIQFNYRDGWAEFQIGSVTEVMKESEGFSVSCESKASPSTWFELQEMTVPKALYHYLRWHSTVLNTTDFQYIGDNRLVQYFDTDRASLYDSVNSFLSEGMIGETVADRQGKIWGEISPIGYENPYSSISDGMTIDRMDWIGEPNITIRRSPVISFVEMGGIAYEGVDSNGYKAFLSNAPSKTPLYRGKTDGSKQGLILNSQTQLNKITGNYLASKNAQIEDVTLSLAGNYRNFDIAPQEKLYLLVDGSETDQNISLLGKPFRMMSMTWNYSPEKDLLYPDITLEQISTGTAGETIIIPPSIENSGYTSFPSFPMPEFPDFNTSVSPPTQQETQYMLGYEVDDDTMFYSTNFDDQYPEWISWRYGIESDVQLAKNNRTGMFITPNGAVWVIGFFETSASHGRQAKRLYRAPYMGGQFERIIDESWLEGLYGSDSPSINVRISQIGFDASQSETVIFTVTFASFSSTCQTYIGNSGGWQSSNAYGNPGTAFLGKISRGANKNWLADSLTASQEGFTILDPNGNFIKETQFGQGSLSEHTRAGTTNIALRYKYGVTGVEGILRTEDNGENITLITIPELIQGYPTNIVSDPTGQYLMANYENGVYRARSYDGGYTWSLLTNMLPAGANTTFGYCGGEGQSSRWVAGNGAIYYSNNFGSSWVDKTGNLLQVFLPPSGADILRFIPYLAQAEI